MHRNKPQPTESGTNPSGEKLSELTGKGLPTCSGPLSNIFLVLGNWWEWGVYWTATLVTLGRTDARSRLTGCLGTSLVRLELLVLVVGGDPLRDRTEGHGLAVTGCELCMWVLLFSLRSFLTRFVFHG